MLEYIKIDLVFNRIITEARFGGVYARRLIPHGLMQIGHGGTFECCVNRAPHTHTCTQWVLNSQFKFMNWESVTGNEVYRR
jgi:hypothetical protein